MNMVKSMRSDEFLQAFIDGALPFLVAQGVEESERKNILLDMIEAFRDTLINGETVLIREATKQLVEYASMELPADDLYDETLFPFRQAVVFFESPRIVRYPFNDGPKIREVEITMPWMAVMAMEHVGPFEPLHIYFMAMSYIEDPPGSVRAIGVMACSPNSTIGTASDQRGLDELQKSGYFTPSERDIAMFNPKPFVQALWALISQPIISEQIVRPIDPPARKTRKRLGNGGTVRVLSIRQRQGHGEGGRSGGNGSREWSHRWVVRGFWRMQRCGPRGADRKRIWIDAYVKGPADKPLMIGDKVYRE